MEFGPRHTCWLWIRRRVAPGALLPRWALYLRAVLFPLDSFYWWMSGATGYDLMTDTWLIGGVRYSSGAMHRLANAHGELYRIRRVGDVVTLEYLQGQQVSAATEEEPGG